MKNRQVHSNPALIAQAFVNARILFALSVFLLLALTASAGTVTIGWTPSPTPTVITTRVYYGVASRTYTNYVAVPVPQTTIMVSNLVAGVRYYLTAIAWDGQRESIFSNEVIHKQNLSGELNVMIYGH